MVRIAQGPVWTAFSKRKIVSINWIAVRLLPVIVAISLCAAAPPAVAQTLAGVYSSVRLHPETGDVLGDEIEFRAGSKLMAVVTICEGACWGGKAWPVVVMGNRIAISVLMQGLVDQDGRPAQDQPIHLVGSLSGGTLRIEVQGDPSSREVLKQIRNPRPNQTAMLGCGKAEC